MANQNEITNGTTILNMNSQRIAGLGTPTVSTDAVNLGYLSSNYMSGTSTLDTIATLNPATASVSLNS